MDHRSPAMLRGVRLLLLATTLGATAFVGTAGAHAKQTGFGCGSTSSAINQYCESIPTANGRGSPPPGTAVPILGTSLPPRAVRGYRRLSVAARHRAQNLLSLPATTAKVPLSASIVHKSAWSLPLGLVVAMLAIAAAGLFSALVRRRRRSG